MKRYATAKIVLDTQHKEAKEKLLKVRIIHNRIPRLFSIGDDTIRLTKEQFKNSRLLVTQNAMDVADKALRIAKEIIQELGENFTFASFREKYIRSLTGRGAISSSFDSLLAEYFNDPKHSCKYKTMKSYETSVNWVIRYRKKATLSSITPDFVEGLISFMKREHMKEHNKEMSENSIRMYLRQLRAIYNFAISKGYIHNQENPFAIMNLESIGRQNAALSWEEMSRLIEYTPKNKEEEFGKDFFLITFYCLGANLGDILLFKNSDIQDGYITFRRRKTRSSKAKPIRIPLTEPAKELLNKYGYISEATPNSLILPFLANCPSEKTLVNRISRYVKKTNDGLKSICINLGCRKITTYNARHTVGTALRDEGKSAEIIQKIYGHNSVTTTELYLQSLSTNTLDDIKDIIEGFGKRKTETLI